MTGARSASAWLAPVMVCLALSACDQAPRAPGAAGDAPARARVSPPVLRSCEPTTVDIEIAPATRPIPTGAVVRIRHYTKPWRGLARGLEQNPPRNRLVGASRSDGVTVDSQLVARDRYGFAGRSHYDFRIEGSPLEAPHVLRVTYGTSAVPIAAGRKQRAFVPEIGLDPEGDGTFQEIPVEPLQIRAGEPESLHAVLPSHGRPDEPVELILYAEDRCANVCDAYQGALEITGEGTSTTYRMKPLSGDGEMERNATTVRFPQEGVFTVTVEDPQRGLQCVSNPIVVSSQPPERALFWGDLQVHTAISDGEGSLEDVYRDAYARGHDFLAITDHGFGRPATGSREARLERVVETARRFTVPGRFVAIPAGETHFLAGTHMNLYFDRLDAGHMLRIVRRLGDADTRVRSWRSAGTGTLRRAAAQYWAAFDDPEFARFPLVFPHHTMWMGVEEYIRDERQRLIEIYSFHGSSESEDFSVTPEPLRGRLPQAAERPGPKYGVREALSAGHRLGIVGGSDDHFGQAGSHALTGVYAESLALPDLLTALHDRRCFAVSGHRTIVEFSANGEPMGATLPAGTPVRLRARVVADGSLDRLQIIGPGGTVHEIDAAGSREATLAWRAPAAEGHYYLRALLESGHAAWSSPIWVE